jgi:hypothetical protein
MVLVRRFAHPSFLVDLTLTVSYILVFATVPL